MPSTSSTPGAVRCHRPVTAAVAGELCRPAPAAVARYFGGPAYRLTDRVREQVQTAIDTACAMAAPVFTFTLTPASFDAGERTVRLPNASLPAPPDQPVPASVRYLAAAIATLGPQLEATCRQLLDKKETYRALLFDAVGTAMLDLVATRCWEAIQQAVEEFGLHACQRFSPGLEGVAMELQPLLFGLADPAAAGVRLNDAHLMEPLKTISFFTVISTVDDRSMPRNKCRRCSLTRCQFRVGAAT